MHTLIKQAVAKRPSIVTTAFGDDLGAGARLLGRSIEGRTPAEAANEIFSAARNASEMAGLIISLAKNPDAVASFAQGVFGALGSIDAFKRAQLDQYFASVKAQAESRAAAAMSFDAIVKRDGAVPADSESTAGISLAAYRKYRPLAERLAGLLGLPSVKDLALLRDVMFWDADIFDTIIAD